jgi:alpha-galactosidase/6-phospho-beta-glucosidase family protein
MFCRLIVVAFTGAAFCPVHAADPALNHHGQALVVNVENAGAISDFQPNAAVVQTMVDQGVTTLTGKTNLAAAWCSLVSTQDVVGVKVFSEAGMLSGSRPAVVTAVIQGLLAAGLPPTYL